MLPDIDYSYLLEQLYGGDTYNKVYNDILDLGGECRSWWKTIVDTVMGKHSPQLTGTPDGVARHYLSIEDAMALGDNFFQQLYGTELYSRMLELKYRSGLSGEAEFISWLLVQVEGGDLEQEVEESGGVRAKDGMEEDDSKEYQSTVNAPEYDTTIKTENEQLHIGFGEHDLVASPVIDFDIQEDGTFIPDTESNETTSHEVPSEKKVQAKMRKRRRRFILNKPAAWKREDPEAPKKLRHLPNKPSLKESDVDEDSASEDAVDEGASDTGSNVLESSKKRRKRRNRGKPCMPKPPGKPFTKEMIEEEQFNVTTALSVAGYLRSNRYRFYVDPIPIVHVGKPFVCSTCNKSYRKISACIDHYKNKHPLTPTHKCKECGEEFGMEAMLRLHFATHHANRPGVQCDQCGAVLRDKRGLHSHRKYVHTGNRVKNKKCEQCDKMFHEQNLLKQHIRLVHNKYKSCMCSYCGLACASTYQLRAHLKIHEQDRAKHMCQHCGKEFITLKWYEAHVAYVHEGKERCPCDLCGKVFNGPDLLKSHMLTHGEKRYQCTVCLARFANGRNLRNHVKAYHAHGTGSEESTVVAASSLQASAELNKTKEPIELKKTEPESSAPPEEASVAPVLPASWTPPVPPVPPVQLYSPWLQQQSYVMSAHPASFTAQQTRYT